MNEFDTNAIYLTGCDFFDDYDTAQHSLTRIKVIGLAEGVPEENEIYTVSRFADGKVINVCSDFIFDVNEERSSVQDFGDVYN